MTALRLAFVVLAALGFGACQPSTPPAGAKPASAPVALTPRGPTSFPIIFSWKPPPGSDWVYRIVVTDQAERVLYHQDCRGAISLRGPNALKDVLGGRATFIWYVAILGVDDQELARSEPTTFSIR